jgi:hypothetical protein
MGWRVSGSGPLRKRRTVVSKEDPMLSDSAHVITGLVPVISIGKARRFTDRNGRD